MQDILRKLHELLARHRKLQDDVDLENILEILDQTSVWIAGVDPSSFDFKNPVYEQDLLKKLDLPFWPDLLCPDCQIPEYSSRLLKAAAAIRQCGTVPLPGVSSRSGPPELPLSLPPVRLPSRGE